jgi:hypothetical protein
MAHFARIESGIVSEVIVIANDVLLDENGEEQESIGVDFCKNLFGGEWVQTSYNGNFRGRFANPGHLWNGKEFTAAIVETGEVV